MIRLGKEIQLLEWGLGTSTVTQNWNIIGTGTLKAKPKNKMGATLITVELDGAVEKKNAKDDSLKIMQRGEGMTPNSDKWGEVAMGRIKTMTPSGGKTIVEIEIKSAMKIGGGGPG
jgi:hypothetical protein